MIDAQTLSRIECDLDQVNHARVMAMVNLNTHGIRVKYFEIRLEERHPENQKTFRFISTVSFPLSEAQRLGVTQTLNGTKKLKAWLDTPEGLKHAVDWKRKFWRSEHESFKRLEERKEGQRG